MDKKTAYQPHFIGRQHNWLNIRNDKLRQNAFQALDNSLWSIMDHFTCFKDVQSQRRTRTHENASLSFDHQLNKIFLWTVATRISKFMRISGLLLILDIVPHHPSSLPPRGTVLLHLQYAKFAEALSSRVCVWSNCRHLLYENTLRLDRLPQHPHNTQQNTKSPHAVRWRCLPSCGIRFIHRPLIKCTVTCRTATHGNARSSDSAKTDYILPTHSA
jgi:hypothetical protein